MNNKATPIDHMNLDDIMALDTEQIEKIIDEHLVELLNKINQIESFLSKEKKMELREIKKKVQNTLNRNEKKYGDLAFQTVNGKRYVSANHIYYKMRMKHVVRTAELETLENWLNQKSLTLTTVSKYSFSYNPNCSNITFYFEYDKVLRKITEASDKKQNNILKEIPFFYNSKDVIEFLGISIRRFNSNEIKDILNCYNLQISNKLNVMYAEDDIFDIMAFINFYKSQYIQDGIYKRGEKNSPKSCLEQFNNLSEKEMKKYLVNKDLFINTIRNFTSSKRAKKITEEN